MDTSIQFPKNQIWVIDNVISQKNCEKIVKIIKDGIKKNIHSIEDYGVGRNVCSKTVNSSDVGDEKLSQELTEFIRKKIHFLISKKIKTPAFSILKHCGFQLREISGETLYHTDGHELEYGIVRTHSIIIALNDDYEGGEFYFNEQNFKTRLKAGQAIVFPPFWTHPHGVTAPINGTKRYTINTWMYETPQH